MKYNNQISHQDGNIRHKASHNNQDIQLGVTGRKRSKAAHLGFEMDPKIEPR